MRVCTIGIAIGLMALAGRGSSVPLTAEAAAQAPATSAPATGEELPASEDSAKMMLQQSPRHGEWISVMDRLLITQTYVVHAPQGGRSPLVLVIHDDRGLTDWTRAIGDQLAREGLTAVIPDLLSGAGPNGGGTSSFPSQAALTRAIGQLPREQVMQRLEGVWNYAMRLPGLTGKGAVIGFDWGGAHSFSFASIDPDVGTLTGAVVFYGRTPDLATLAALKAPVLGLYAGDDPAITETVGATTADMKRLGKSYETIVFAGASHGFVRAQTTPAANRVATQQAWSKAVAFLREHTN